MLNNILVAIMSVIALGAGIFGWWMEHGNSSDTSTPETDHEDVGNQKSTENYASGKNNNIPKKRSKRE